MCLYVTIRLKEQCILLSADGPDRNVLKFKPPMCFSMEDADELLSKLDAIFAEIERGRNDFEKRKLLAHDSANGATNKLTSEPISKKQKLAA